MFLWLYLVLVGLGHAGGPALPGEDLGICRYRALLFAAQNYEDRGFRDLDTPFTDVAKLAGVLRDTYGFETQIIKDPTRADILDGLARLDRTTKRCDAVLVYYAGHGETDPDPRVERGFWLPVDAAPDSRANWITTSDVAESIQALDAPHVWLIADSCFSGSLFRNARGLDSLTDAAAVNQLAHRDSRWVFTSGGNEPVVDRYRGGMSVFAYFLHLELSEAPGPYVTPDQLFPKVRNLVRANASQSPEQGSLHGTGHEGGQLVMKARGRALPSPARATPSTSSAVSPKAALEAYQSGERAYKAKNYTQGAVHFETACGGGNGKGCTYLGYLYENGFGVNEDLGRAAQLYRRGCDRGSLTGCQNLGILYMTGASGTQDDVRARELLDQHGRGVTKDLARARELYERACNDDYAKGCSNLGTIYGKGYGVDVDRARARQSYAKAAVWGARSAARGGVATPSSATAATRTRPRGSASSARAARRATTGAAPG